MTQVWVREVNIVIYLFNMYVPVYIEGKQDYWNSLSKYAEANNY